MSIANWLRARFPNPSHGDTCEDWFMQSDGFLSLQYLPGANLWAAYCNGVAGPDVHPNPMLALKAAYEHGCSVLGKDKVDRHWPKMCDSIPAFTPGGDCGDISQQWAEHLKSWLRDEESYALSQREHADTRLEEVRAAVAAACEWRPPSGN